MGYSFKGFGVKPVWFILVLLLLFANNKVRYIINRPWKDIPYSFSLLAVTINLMWIYFTEGEWLAKKANLIVFALSFLLVLFLRHNGILVFIPTIIVLLMVYKKFKKYIWIVSASILAFHFLITGPLYNMLDIQGHSHPFSEAVGVPNNQISFVIAHDGHISEEELEFVDNIIPIEIIKSHYEDGNFNTIKFMLNDDGENYYNADFVEENKKDYLKVWFSLLRKNVKYSMKAHYYATEELWRCNLGITEKMTYNVGMMLFISTLFVFAAALRSPKKLIVYLPMALNMISIIFLVTGGEMRFVFANIVVGAPLIIFALMRPLESEKKMGERS